MKNINAFVASVVLAVVSSAGAERLVPEDYPTIAAAFAACVAGDVVSVGSGTFNVGTITMPAVPITLRGRGLASETVLTGAMVNVFSGSGVRTIENLTMRGFTDYAAIQVHGASAIVRSVTLEDNAVHGIFLNTNATADTTDCVFRGSCRGGYAYVNSTWNATDCSFEFNSCDAYGGGAAFHVGSGGSFLRCNFVGNAAGAGGAIGLSFGGSRVFDQCFFEGNTSPNGPVWWTEFGASGVLKNSTLCGHSAADIVGGWVDGGGNQFFPKGCAPPCPGDISGNNIVDGVDLAALLGTWGTNGQGEFDCDIDNDGLVAASDLAFVLSDWGPCPN